MVINLGHRAHGGAGIFTGSLLLDGNRWRETFKKIDIGFVHLSQELPGIGGKRLNITTLAFGIQGIKGQG